MDSWLSLARPERWSVALKRSNVPTWPRPSWWQGHPARRLNESRDRWTVRRLRQLPPVLYLSLHRTPPIEHVLPPNTGSPWALHDRLLDQAIGSSQDPVLEERLSQFGSATSGIGPDRPYPGIPKSRR